MNSGRYNRQSLSYQRFTPYIGIQCTFCLNVVTGLNPYLIINIIEINENTAGFLTGFKPYLIINITEINGNAAGFVTGLKPYLIINIIEINGNAAGFETFITLFVLSCKCSLFEKCIFLFSIINNKLIK